MRTLRGRADLGATRQQLVHGDSVEVGELEQSLHGHGAVAALVGADDDGLPTAVRLLLDPVQGQTLLLANGSQLGAESLGVFLWHWCLPPVGVNAGAGLARGN